MKTSLTSRAIASLAILSIAIPASAEIQYEVLNIGNVPGGDYGYIGGMNNLNQVVGTSYTQEISRGFIWKEDTGLQQVYSPSFDSTQANDINDNGLIVGSTITDFALRGMSTKDGNWWVNFPESGNSSSATYGVNNLNQSVGIGNLNNVDVATSWQFASPGFRLPNYGDQERSTAFAINDAGDSVGYAYLAGTSRATLFRSNNNLFDLHGLLPVGTTSSTAHDINNAGWIVGSYNIGPNFTGGFIFNLELGMQLIDSPDPAKDVNLRGISDNGIAVGNTSDSFSFAARWTSDTGVVDLNTLIDPNGGWVLFNAKDVNNNGWIAGEGSFNGVQTNYVLRPIESVPEPASMTILALGIGALAARARRKK